ncbi:TPM domain-containing protein [Paenibacillus hodogayensis]|uniref:TPM domain-containing protein n=1 Tax=Paenibacillus hodogayensis TaxID=279208 RepID=A0ABV5VV39_9BACL
MKTIRLLVPVVVLFFLAAASFSFPAMAVSKSVPRQIGDIYVQDHAGLLSEKDAAQLVASGKSLEATNGTQLALLTVQSLEGSDLAEFANEAFRTYGLGDKKKNNGILIVLAAEERKIRIEVGYGLEDVITDSKAGRLLDMYAVPYMESGKLKDAAKNAYSALYYTLLTNGSFDWSAYPSASGSGAYSSSYSISVDGGNGTTYQVDVHVNNNATIVVSGGDSDDVEPSEDRAEPSPLFADWRYWLEQLLELDTFRSLAIIIGVMLIVCDFMFFKGRITRIVLFILLLFRGRGGGIGGKGGSSGGGGASR